MRDSIHHITQKINLFKSSVFALSILLSSIYCIAQSPGGVSTNLKQWYKANGNVSTTGSNVTGWNSHTANGVHVSLITGTPQLVANGLNFNPVIAFDGSNYMSSIDVKATNFCDPSNNTTFIVFTNKQAASTYGGVMSKWENSVLNRMTWETNSAANLRFDFPNYTTGQISSNTIVYPSSYIGSAFTNNISDSLNVNGILEAKSNISGLFLDTTLFGKLQIGANVGNGTYSYTGDIAEIIYYNRHLTFTERRKVETYLAIKYGITLGNNSNLISYTNSSNAVIWTGNNIYQNNMAGIGRDDASGLNQKQSASINTGNTITMALGNIASTNSTNSNSFSSNQSFLIWGDDNKALSTTTSGIPSSVKLRLSNTWKTQETGIVGKVRLRFSGANTIFASKCIDYNNLRLLVDADANFTTAATTIVPVNYDNTNKWVDFDVDFTSSTGYFFTIGSLQDLDAPLVSNVIYCQGDVPSVLMATGPNLKWYNSASGGTALSSAPIPSTVNSGNVSYWVSQSVGSCESPRSQVNVTVKSTPIVLSGNDTICSGTTSNVVLKASLLNVTYSWVAPTQTNVTGGLASTGTPTAINQTLTNNSNITGTALYGVKASVNGCTSLTKGITIYVLPLPTVISKANDTICSNTSTNIALSSNVTGAKFSWGTPTLSNTTGGQSSTGSPVNISQTLNTTSNFAGTAVYNVVATNNGCAGNTKTITVLVNPTPVITASDGNICSELQSNLSLSSNVVNTSFSWASPIQTNVNGGTANAGTNGNLIQTFTNNSTTTGKAVYQIFGTANKCVSSPKTITINVFPKPKVLSTNDTVCSQAENTNIPLSSNIAGATFSWTTPLMVNVTGGSPNVGNQNNISQLLKVINQSSGTATYSVIANANGCLSDPLPVQVVVNPRPSTFANKQVLCSGDTTNITITSDIKNAIVKYLAPMSFNVTGGTYDSIGKKDINYIKYALYNNTLNTGYATFFAYATLDGCTGGYAPVDVNVYPKPVVIASNDTICAGNITNIQLSAALPNVNFSWSLPTQNQVQGGVASNGFPSAIQQNLSTTGNNIGTATYNVVASSNYCSSLPQPITVVVNPLPVVAANDTAICSNNFTRIVLNSSVQNATFDWKVVIGNEPLMTLFDINIIKEKFINTTNTTQKIQYYVTGTANNCTGPTKIVKVDIHPLPSNPSVTNVQICENAPAPNLNNIVKGSNIKWFSDSLGTVSISTPTINSNIIGNYKYFVSQTDTNTCESEKTRIDVSVAKSIAPPLVTDIYYCKNQSADSLTANGANLIWYANEFGGVGQNAAPVPATNLVGETSYWVSQKSGICESSRSNIKVIINELPQIKALASKTSVCENDTVTLQGSGAESYRWNKQVINKLAFIPTSSGYYEVAGTDTNNCTANDSIFIQVNKLPNINIVSSKDSLCEGDSIILTASGASTYIWDNGVINNTYFSPKISKSYTVKATDLNNCSNNASKSIVVISLPNIQLTVNKDTVCKGDTVAFTALGGINYTWNKSLLPNNQLIVEYNQTIISTGENTFGCKNKDTITVIALEVPLLKTTISHDTICIGGSIKINASGADTYIWDQNIYADSLFSPQGSEIYTVTGFLNNGCSAKASTKVAVVPNIPQNVKINSSKNTICLGDSINLSYSGASKYIWLPNIPFNNKIKPIVSQQYLLIGYNSQGCFGKDSIFIKVNPLPIITINASNTTICKGKSITLEATGAKTYSWNKQITQKQVFSPTESENYTVTGTDSNNCSNQANVFINVDSVPANVNTQDISICKYDVTSSLLAQYQSSNIKWYTSETSNSFLINKIKIDSSLAQKKTFYLTQTNGYGCESASKTALAIEVKELPIAKIIANQTNFCNTTQKGVLLKASNPNATSYQWFKNNQLQKYTAAQIDTASSGKWQLKITQNGCTDTSAKVEIIEYTVPNAKINASQSSYCFGNNGVTLSAIDLGPKADYEWFRDGVAQANTNIKRNTVYNATKGSWKLVIFSNGCLGVGDTFTVNETKLPDPIILNKSDSLKYFEGGKGVNLYLNQFPVGSTYFWYKDDKFQDSTKTNIYRLTCILWGVDYLWSKILQIGNRLFIPYISQRVIRTF